MRTSHFVAAAMTITLATTAMAQEFQFAGFRDVESAFASQQDEIGQLRAQLAAFQEQADPVQALDSATCCKGGCDACCCPSVTASADLLLLTAHHNYEDAANRFDTEAGYRLTIGRDNGCGSGFRVRYMDWDAREADDDEGQTIDVIDVQTVDVEFYTGCDICCNTSLEFSAGVRYFDYLEDWDIDDDDSIYQVNGWGPTVSIGATHSINDCYSFFTLLRESVVSVHGNYFGDDIENQSGLLSEVQVGVGYTRCMCSGMMFVRAAIEGQHYSNIAEGAGYGAGLLGGHLSAGITR